MVSMSRHDMLRKGIYLVLILWKYMFGMFQAYITLLITLQSYYYSQFLTFCELHYIWNVYHVLLFLIMKTNTIYCTNCCRETGICITDKMFGVKDITHNRQAFIQGTHKAMLTSLYVSLLNIFPYIWGLKNILTVSGAKLPLCFKWMAPWAVFHWSYKINYIHGVQILIVTEQGTSFVMKHILNKTLLDFIMRSYHFPRGCGITFWGIYHDQFLSACICATISHH